MRKIIFTLLFLLAACQSNDVKIDFSDAGYEQALAETIGERRNETVNGAETYVLEYGTETGDGATVRRRVEHNGTDARLILEVSGGSIHRETIPKEFAAHVDDIEFSIEPDRIINPDPEVEWALKLEGVRFVGIEMKTRAGTAAEELFDAFDRMRSFRLCEKIAAHMRDPCYASAVAALEKPDAADCSIITGLDMREACISTVAIKQDRHSICRQILTADIRGLCYLAFAIKRGDISFCDSIAEDTERRLCRLAYEAHEKGVSVKELAEEKATDTGREPHMLDILVSPDADEMKTGTTYVFEAALDPHLDSAVFEFSINGHKVNTTGEFSKSFDKPGSYLVSVSAYKNGKLAHNSVTVTIAEGESGELAASCADDAESCAEECNKLCEQAKADYCDTHGYSGCALDVFCWCNACAIYDEKWCPRYPGFISCAEGAKGTYRGCIESCQSKQESGADVSTCWADCNTAFEEEIIQCKQGPCNEFCSGNGYTSGEWARYTQEHGWDSCLCS